MAAAACASAAGNSAAAVVGGDSVGLDAGGCDDGVGGGEICASMAMGAAAAEGGGGGGGGNAAGDVSRLLASLMQSPQQLQSLRLLLGVPTNAALPPLRPYSPPSEGDDTQASQGNAWPYCPSWRLSVYCVMCDLLLL